ncbi:glutamate synthase large subunit [Nitrosomonas sp. ANs5]|uniref:glutamate synthase large subunit n=1 Tax=Nitrosomonas sp. ANs5 TaxID=3423941 RepID=UPI003D34F36F
MMRNTILPRQGLYDPADEHDACGVGFITHIKGRHSHQLVLDALDMLRNMDHRGACGCEKNTGDGAGILTGIPDAYMREIAQHDFDIDLPEPGRYSIGNIFLPPDPDDRAYCKRQLEYYITQQEQILLGWRTLPTDADKADIGLSARLTQPAIEQLFIAAAPDLDEPAFCRQLYLLRKQAYHRIAAERPELLDKYYVCSLNNRVIVYKGQLTSGQVPLYYPDLLDSRFSSHLAMVHSRFSTNTFPSWDRAQPMRFLGHNGEINTLRGNINWIRAREELMDSDLFAGEFKKLLPIIDQTTSDSGVFDNVLELLLLAGRPLPEAVMMMIPEAWQNNPLMSAEKRAFYEYFSCLMEPWDGPALVTFTDGRYIGAVLDRNGLRPGRFTITHDDRVIMASEAGVLPSVAASMVKTKGRMQPGHMFLVDTDEGRLIPDDELKNTLASHRPYARWLAHQRLRLEDLPAHRQQTHEPDPQALLARMQAFGYTTETLQFILRPMILQKRDPIGSMGNDAALAVLSEQPRLLYDYFKQLFAQVTNPPIDSIRESEIMSLACYIGPEGNLLTTTEQHAHRLYLPEPILSNAQLSAIKQIDRIRPDYGWKTLTIDITWNVNKSGEGLDQTLARICHEAEAAVTAGYSLVVLSDRNIGPARVASSMLLAVGAVHQHLVRQGKRSQLGIVIETGEAREVHHHCLLIGYGADAVNPYLAFEVLWQDRHQGRLPPVFDSDDAIVTAYHQAVAKGMLKVMAKMGISTLASYKGAQIFEAIGLSQQVIKRCFAGTASRIDGADLAVLENEILQRHAAGYPRRQPARSPLLSNDGQIHWRAEGEKHALNPQTIALLQTVAQTNSGEAYEQFAKLVDTDDRNRCTLRSLFKFRENVRPAISLEAVESAASIVRRFRTGAMSFGSISSEAHETLAIAMNRIGGKSNTGEGGEDPARFIPDQNGDLRRSAIKQIASGRFGVTGWYLANADELQIKMAQGAKPGEGGELPSYKVDRIIAKTRHAIPGVGLISPPPHHDIYSIEDLAQLIYDLKNANPSAIISVKLVAEMGVGTIAAGVAKAHADHILISGHDGGTGASPWTSIKHAGLPWELGISEAHQTLVLNDLRSRVSLETDGQLKTGRDVVIATLLGAEKFGFATIPLITLGCIMMRKCHLNTCPVGVATQDPQLRKNFAGKPEYVINYLFMVAEHTRRIMAELGFATIEEMVGQVEMLETNEAVRNWKNHGLDLSPILTPAQPPAYRQNVGRFKQIKQNHGLEQALDNELIRLAHPALQSGDKVIIDLPIFNTHRTVGTMLSHALCKAYGAAGLPDDTITIKLTGSAGQSVAAWLQRGITIRLEGEANDYVGKGLSGGKLIIYPPRCATYAPEENVIIGNVALYGATSGEAYFRGMAAERFCVRNSGAHAVVEGVGDNGCEYMTAGRVAVLGPTGRNFAAGMSGGIAYVWDPASRFRAHCNPGSVTLEKMENKLDIIELHEMIENHYRYTGSTVARNILDNWEHSLTAFTKVMPIDYQSVLLGLTVRADEVEKSGLGAARIEHTLVMSQ